MTTSHRQLRTLLIVLCLAGSSDCRVGQKYMYGVVYTVLRLVVLRVIK